MNLPAELRIDLDEQFPHLARAPIVEAVIHWQARARKNLEPEQLGEHLKERLPSYPDSKLIRKLQFETTIEADRSSTQRHSESWVGFRFTSEHEPYVAQFTRDGFVFSRLEPYENWEMFAGEAQRLWRVFVELAKPVEVERLGVRFINRIAPVKIDELGKLLQRPPKRLDALGLPISNFLYQSTHEVPGYPYRINVIDTVQPTTPLQDGGPALILDIDAFTTRAFDAQEDVVNRRLIELHWLKNKAFFSLLTKSAIRQFGKGEQ